MNEIILKFCMRHIKGIYRGAPEEAKETEHWLCAQEQGAVVHKSVQDEDQGGF